MAYGWLLCPLQGTSCLLSTQNKTEGPEHRTALAALLEGRQQWHDPNLFLLKKAEKGPWLFARQLLKAGKKPQKDAPLCRQAAWLNKGAA